MSGRNRPPEWERDDSRPRAILVGVDRGPGEWPAEESLAELERLAYTAGIDVATTAIQRLDKANPRTFIGSGKAVEIAQMAHDLSVSVIIFDEELTPRQQVNIEGLVPDTRILDRTALILEIFAMHAVSREGKLQVELAQLEYLLPRLRGMWGHLERERLGGGRGARFGAGESQLETDRRLARRRIADLKRELRHVAAARTTQRKARSASGVYRVALVGYTNAGKSSLLNVLTGAEALAYDMLFATLDSTTRRLTLADGREITLTDTVGFINKLPHGLVEAFKSTLDEVNEADLLLHVVDASHPQAEAQMAAVDLVLSEIGANGSPRIVVFNKIDRLDSDERARLAARYRDGLFVSAVSGEGTDELLSRLATEAGRTSMTMTVLVPYTHGELVRIAHEHTHLVSERHTAEGTRLVISAPKSVASRFRRYAIKPEEESVHERADAESSDDIMTSDAPEERDHSS
ncbi:MAG: GTPase HflX [Coriobacteriia bacterium]|jgi:GTP-binding protein HflX|nr:GTPase HflX [Coriobacteriia bacterium]